MGVIFDVYHNFEGVPQPPKLTPMPRGWPGTLPALKKSVFGESAPFNCELAAPTTQLVMCCYAFNESCKVVPRAVPAVVLCVETHFEPCDLS